jgi:hypothetical protein
MILRLFASVRKIEQCKRWINEKLALWVSWVMHGEIL